MNQKDKLIECLLAGLKTESVNMIDIPKISKNSLDKFRNSLQQVEPFSDKYINAVYDNILQQLNIKPEDKVYKFREDSEIGRAISYIIKNITVPGKVYYESDYFKSNTAYCTETFGNFIINIFENQKITESIDWKRDIHDQNYDYKTNEKGMYGRVDYPDTIYDFGTFYINNNQFSVTFMKNDFKNKQFNNTYNISSIHPYDNSDYHYATAVVGDTEYKIYLKGKFIKSIPVTNISSDEDIENVAKELLDLDKDINPKMSYN